MPQPRMEEYLEGEVTLAAMAKAMAHPARIRVLAHLAQNGESAALVIAGRLPLAQPAVSRHLRELAEAGLLSIRPSGNHVYYSLNEAALTRQLGNLVKSLGVEVSALGEPGPEEA